MKKQNEIKKVLEFYVLSNKLKTNLVDEINNFSYADNIFGSMILAIAMDSEYKESNDLGKILRMLILDDWNKLNPNYPLDSLKLGKQYENELRELRDFKTKEAKLVFKYKMLDFSLTKLIAEKGNKLNYNELLKEAETIIGCIGYLNQNNPLKYKEIFDFYYLNYRLKNKIRSGWDNTHWNIKSDRIERISEHIIGTMSLAMVIKSELEYKVDLDKVLKMLCIHEVGETLIGDITPFDGITPEKKKEIEQNAMIDALGNLSEKDRLLSILFEFDEHKTSEAKFSYFCDKIDADLQAKLYQDQGLQHTLDDQKNNCVFASSKVKKMLEEGATTAFDIWYNWDKVIYADDRSFPEFSLILKTARDNDLLSIHKMVLKDKVELTADEHKKIVEQIALVARKLNQDENIDCVYLTNWQQSGLEKGLISIVLLLKDGVNYYHYERMAEQLKETIRNNNDTGVFVTVNYDFASKYSTIALNPSEVRRIEELAESSIIFDKSGRITSVKEEVQKYGHLYPHYLVDYVPPIEDEVCLQLKKNIK